MPTGTTSNAVGSPGVTRNASKIFSRSGFPSGPTEAAIDVTRWACADDRSSEVPIGRPIWNTQAYVLEGGLESVPAGVVSRVSALPPPITSSNTWFWFWYSRNSAG